MDKCLEISYLPTFDSLQVPSGLDGSRSVSTSQVSLFSSVPYARHEDLFSNGQRQNVPTGISAMGNGGALESMNGIREALRDINASASRSTSRLSMGNFGRLFVTVTLTVTKCTYKNRKSRHYCSVSCR